MCSYCVLDMVITNHSHFTICERPPLIEDHFEKLESWSFYRGSNLLFTEMKTSLLAPHSSSTTHSRPIYTTSQISVRASESELGRNRNKWTDVSCLHWFRVRVPDFCLGPPCPSSSIHVAISSDADVQVRPRLRKAHAQSRLCTWSLLQATKMAMASDNLGCSVNKTRPGLGHWLGHCKYKCALTDTQ